MNMIHEEIGQLVRKNFKASTLLLSKGIDFCCGGDRTLEQAAKEAGIDPNALAEELSTLYANEQQDIDFDTLELKELIAFILEHHHNFIYNECPITLELMEKVYRVHGANHPELSLVREVLQQLIADMHTHQSKEEHILFPFIIEMEQASLNGEALCGSCFGHVSQPISMMEQEHEATGELLMHLKMLTNSFQTPPDACTSYTTLYQRLEEIFNNILQHVHLENNILHVKSIELQNRF